MLYDIYKNTKEAIDYIKNYFLNPLANAAIYDMYNSEKKEYQYKHFLKEKLDTAYCYFKDNTFNIVIGKLTGFKNVNTDADRIHITKSLLFHELGHALYTTTEDEKLEKVLRENKIKFSFWNIAEDIRINELIRNKILYESQNIFWLDLARYIKLPDIGLDAAPENLLLYISLTENQKDITHPLYSKVLSYYEEMVEAKDSFEIITICKKWKDEFDNLYKSDMNERINEIIRDFAKNNNGEGQGEETEEEKESQDKNNNRKNERQQTGQESGEGQGEEQGENADIGTLSDLLFGDAKPNKDTELLEKMTQSEDTQCADPGELAKAEQKVNQNERGKRRQHSKSKAMTHQQYQKNSIPEESNTNILFDPKKSSLDDIDFSEVEKVEKEFRKLKTTMNTQKNATRKPTKKLNTKTLSCYPISPSTTKVFIKKNSIERSKFDNIKWKIYLDLSGSMEGKPLSFEKTFLFALNNLCKQYHGADISIVASCSGKALQRNNSSKGFGVSVQTIKLPYDSVALSGIKVYGGDGMLSALIGSEENNKNPKNNLSTKDAAIFITDGYFADGYLTKNHIQKYSKDTLAICLYVGEDTMFSKNNAEIFDYTVHKTDMLSAIKELVDICNSKNLQKREHKISEQIKKKWS